MSATEPRLSRLSGTDLHRLELLLVEFDRGWEDGHLDAAARRLPPGDPLRLPALLEMVKVDLEKQWQRGRKAKVEAYLHLYPDLGTPQTVEADLLLAEYQVRHQFGDNPTLNEYDRRFPNRASELRAIIEQGQSGDAHLASVQAGRPTAGAQAPTSPGSRIDASPRLPEQFGRYRILQKLGQGGMATVYLAEDTQLDRKVALKIPQLKEDDRSSTLQRFLREAQAAAKLSHPNICPVHDFGEIGGIHYLSMAYLEGKALSHFLRSRRPVPQRQAALLTRKVALALQEAHARGVVHRDLKPSNIMIDQRKEPIVMDFGLAQRVDTKDIRLTREGVILGTPAYMSPEQAAGEVGLMGPCCDIYSLGVILYEMLTGQLPFEGPLAVVLAQVLTQTPPPPSSLRPDLDPRLEAICQQAMARKPAERFPSMEAFAAALSQYLTTSGKTPAETALRSTSKTYRPSAEENPFGELVAESGPVPVRKAPGDRRSRWGWRIPLAASLTVALGLLLGVVFIIRSENHGTVRIRLPEGVTGVTVQMNGETIDINGLDEPIRLKPGKHHLEVRGKSFKTYTRWIRLTRGGEEVVEVTLEPLVASRKEPPETGKQGEEGRPLPATDHRLPATRNELVAFYRTHRGTPQGLAAARRMSQLPWPVDQLQRKGIADDDLKMAGDGDAAKAPSALVAVLGDGRMKNWYSFTHAVAFHPQGKILATSSGRGVKLWDIATRRLLHAMPARGGLFVMTALAFSPDGRWLGYNADTGGVQLWDVQAGKVVRSLPCNSDRVAFSADSKLIATGGGILGPTCVWTVETGAKVADLEIHGLTTHFQFSPDGKWFASVGEDHKLRLWGVGNWKVPRIVDTGGKTWFMAFSPDSERLASISTVSLQANN
jgi:serine/threonine protein kinase